MTTFPDDAHAEGELHEAFLTKGGSFRVDLRFDNSSHLIVDFEPESDGFARIIDAVTRAAAHVLSPLGARGLTIVGTAEAADAGEEADE